MMKRGSPRQARRLMERMGMKIEQIPNVDQVIIITSTKEIVITSPSVTVTSMQGQDIYQIMGGDHSERKIHLKETNIVEEDVHLVAQQANVGFEEARKALEEADGDLAQAIILLSQKRMG